MSLKLKYTMILLSILFVNLYGITEINESGLFKYPGYDSNQIQRSSPNSLERYRERNLDRSKFWSNRDSDRDSRDYNQNDLQFLQDLIDQSQGYANAPPAYLNPIDLGEQYWNPDGRLIVFYNNYRPWEVEDEEEIYNESEFRLYGDLPESMGDLEYINEIALWNNQITGIPSSIENLHNLEWFIPYANSINEIPEEICNLTGIIDLWFGDNDLNEIPECIGDLTTLEIFGLWGNNLIDLPESFSNLESLYYLELGQNQFYSFPDEIFNLTNLNVLYYWNNDLDDFPLELCELASLDYLHLAHNNLNEMPECIGNLTNLFHLDIGKNDLTSLPYSISNLNNLEELYIGFNLLTEIPEYIGELSNLRQLSIFNNQINSLPESFWNLSNLRQLFIGLNNYNINTFPINQLSSFIYIEEIDFWGFDLEEVPDVVYSFNYLTDLWLGFNNINSISIDILNIENLITLEYQSNNLTELPDNIDQLVNLKNLWLSHNQIEYLPESIGNMDNLLNIDFDNNRINNVSSTICNLDLRWDDYIYFMIGNNFLCENIPYCVESSAGFNIGLIFDMEILNNGFHWEYGYQPQNCGIINTGGPYVITIEHDSDPETMNTEINLEGFLDNSNGDYTCEWNAIDGDGRDSYVGCNLTLQLQGHETGIMYYYYSLTIYNGTAIYGPDTIEVQIHPEPNTPPVIQLTW